jgi:RNA polymerase sigma-70 factor (ECF subfamily)
VKYSRRSRPGTSEPAQATLDLASAYDLHGAELYGFCLNALRDRGAAEECVQEIFTRLWRARDRFDGARASLRTWLFAIARNVVKDAYRQQSRIPVPVEAAHPGHEPFVAEDPEQTLILLEALSTLSAEHRQAILAIHVSGVSYAELAAVTDVPEATLRSRTFYGLRALRQELASEGGPS